MMRLRIDFQKTSPIRFIGHLDLFRIWERTFRRAGIPLAYTQGFKHHPRINIASALPLGFTSSHEIMDFWLDQILPIENVLEALQTTLPSGLIVNQISPIELSAPSLQSILIGSEYQVTFLEKIPNLETIVEELQNRATIEIERRGKRIDIKPYLFSISLLPFDENNNQQLFLYLSSSQDQNARPDEVIQAIDYDPLDALFHRLQLVFENGTKTSQ